MKRLFIILVAAVALGWAGNASATRVSDDFNRANSGTLGANWSNALGFGSGLQIISNQAANVVGGLNASCWGANSFSNDQVSIATLTNALPDADDEVMVRASLVARTAYFGGSRPGDSAFYIILDYIAGVKNILATSATTPIIGDTIELDAVGTTLTLKLTRSGVQTVLLTAADASIASGCVGIEAGDTGSSAARMDNWSGGDFFLDHTGGQLISAPMLPQVTPSATYPPDTGYTLTAVASGANLQTAINAATCGTKLNLAHGGTFTAVAAWTLPNNSCTCHTDPTKWQIIQGDQFEANYVPGVRVDPSVQYAQFPHLSNSDGNYVFTALANGSSCWGFAGLDITSSTDGENSLFMINDGTQTTANYSHDFAWWGNYLHGFPSKGIRRAITLNGNFEAIVDNYISDIHLAGQDGQGIGGWDGFGGILIQNNFIGAGSTAIGFGGSDPRPGVIPSDYTITKNNLWKSLAWRLRDPSYAGFHWQEKNIFETKDSQRLLGTANVLEYSWQDAQTGQAILWNTTNQGGNDPQATNQDINWYYNIVSHASKVYELGANPNPTRQPDHRTFAHDNLDWDIDSFFWADSQSNDVSIAGLASGNIFLPYDNWWVHETISSSSQGVGVEFDNGTDPNYGFIFKDSIIDRSSFGAFKGLGIGDAAMPTPKTPGGQADHNCIYGPNTQFETYNNAIFTGRQLVIAGPSGVFVNPGVDFHVAPASLCHNAASDGTDMGANIDAVNAATAGVVQTLANLHTVTNVSPSTFTHLGSTSITITGTNFISGEAQVIVGGAGPLSAISTDTCGFSNPGLYTITAFTDTSHFTYTGGCVVVMTAPITVAVNDTINKIVNSARTTGTINRYTPGNLCTSPVVVNSTTITCTTPAATGTVTNGPVSVFVSQFGIQAQFNGANYN